MSEKWVAGDDVKAIVTDLVAKYHPHLALCLDEIAVIFKDKSTSIGDVEIVGKTNKAPDLIGVLCETKYKFVITLAADAWADMNDKERVALIDHHLCACRVEEGKNGIPKYSVAPPDVWFYKGEIERHGMWRTSGVPPTADLIKDLFGAEQP
jgi:hypothetical protein